MNAILKSKNILKIKVKKLVFLVSAIAKHVLSCVADLDCVLGLLKNLDAREYDQRQSTFTDTFCKSSWPNVLKFFLDFL